MSPSSDTASLVLTTISDPIVLESYFDNFARFGHLDQVKVFVIPDKKTPGAVYGRCQDLTKRGLKVACPTLDDQTTYLDRMGFLSHLVPYNSDNRRNVGYLMALESGSEFVISIDDDNYCLPGEDFFAAHQIVCKPEINGLVVNTSTGWYNVCDLLQMDRATVTYPRGFPYSIRHQSGSVEHTAGKATVRVNAGLWLQDPDVDGISWLVNPVHSVSLKGEAVLLGDRAWSPVNTQNTALHRDVITSYYFVRMGYPLAGVPIDRYGDIFSGYFAQACVRHMGHSIRFGDPVVEHRRNSHNYMKDAANEWACIMVLEDILPWLTTEVKLYASTYWETYTALSYAIEDIVEKLAGKIWTDSTRGYFHQMGYCMRKWIKACRAITGAS